MKKLGVLLFFLVSIFSLTLVSAIPELNFANQNFQPGETLLGTITGNFAKSIKTSDIQFYEGKKQVFLESDLTFFNSNYYLYVYLTREGNFTIKINNILYNNPNLESINLQKDIIVKQNPIKENNQTSTKILSIQPGFIFTLNPTSEIILVNEGTAQLNITYEFENASQQISISPQDFQKITLTPKKQFSLLTIKSYETFTIPIIYNSPVNSNQSQQNNSQQENQDILKSNPQSFQIKLNEKETQTQELELFNFAEQNITNISILSNISALQIMNYSSQINAKDSMKIDLSFLSDQQGFYQDNITIFFNYNETEKSLTIPLEVYVFPQNYSSQIISNSSEPQVLCSAVGGALCLQNQLCNGTSSWTSDGYCCVGNCYYLSSLDDTSSGSKWWIGLVIIAILGIVGFFIYKKFKKTTPPKPSETMAKTSKIYEKKVSGGLSRN